MFKKTGAVTLLGLLCLGALFCGMVPAAGDGAGDKPAPPPSAANNGDDLILEIQEVEMVRRGKGFEKRTILYTLEVAVRPESAIHLKAIVGRTGIAAEGKAGKAEGDALEVQLKGEMLEATSGDNLPPELRGQGPVFNSRPFAFDGKAQIGKESAIGVLEDENKVYNVTTYLRLMKRADAKALLDQLKEQAPKAK